MDCVICKMGKTHKGKTNFTLEKNGAFLIYKDVEADICDNCGEPYFSAKQVKKLRDFQMKP